MATPIGYTFDGKVIFNDPAMFDLLENPAGKPGTVGAHMRTIGLEIATGARAMAGVRTGNLKRSIHVRQGIKSRSQYVVVSADSEHAYDHHEGTHRHMIYPHVGRVLRFNVGGVTVYAQKVNHPGTKPNPFLTVPMTIAVKG